MPVYVGTGGATVVGSVPLGQPVTTNVTFTSGGTAADPTALTLTVQQPDMTILTLTPVHDATGTYHCTFTPTMAGRHVFRWVATGTAAGVLEDVLDVDAAYAHIGIISLAEAKAQLNKSQLSTTDDAELLEVIDAAVGSVEYLVGDVVQKTITNEFVELTGRTVYNELSNAGTRMFVLRHRPVLTLVSVTSSILSGNAYYDYGAANFNIDTNTGIVRRSDGGSIFGPLNVTYTVGRPTVPAGIRQATKIIVAHMWRTQYAAGRAGRPSVDDDPSSVVPGLGFALPNRALQLLEPYMTTPAVA